MEVQPAREATLGFDRQPVILMSGAVGEVADAGILRERPRFVDEGPVIRNGRIVVLVVVAFPLVRPDIGGAETGAPTLMLDRHVVLHAVRHQKIGKGRPNGSLDMRLRLTRIGLFF